MTLLFSSSARASLLAAVGFLPASLLLFPDLGEGLFYLLALVGGVCLLRGGLRDGELDSVHLPGLLTIGFFASTLVATCCAPDALAGLHKLGKSAHFLATPLVAIALIRLRATSRLTVVAVILGSVAVCLAAMSQYVSLGARAGGDVNALVFGYLSLMLGYFALVRYPLASRAGRLLSLAGFIAACVAVVLSQSRGAWLAAPVLMLTLFLVWWRAGVLSKSVIYETSAAAVVFLMVVINTPLVQQRVNDALDHYQVFTHSGEWNNSVGQRLIMWDSGLTAALQRPLLGWGPHRTQQAAAANLDDIKMRQAVRSYGHLHNEYITALVGKGLVGLVSLLLMLGVPLYLFLKAARNRAQLVEAGIGVMLCAGYALTGLSNLAFGHDIMNVFFIFFLSLTLPTVVSGSSEPKGAMSAPPIVKVPIVR